MVNLRVNSPGLRSVPESNLQPDATIEDELDEMVFTVRDLVNQGMTPDVLMQTCMGYMARCTELHLLLVRIEGTNRKAKQLRTSQLTPVMEMIEFTYKGASRLIENRRQEIELSR